MGLSLPLAVLLGYFVAEPMELGSLAVVVLVLVVLSLPLMMKWYYPMLVLGWNAAFCLAFLPGRIPMWSYMAFIALLFAVLSRAVSPNARFVIEPSITKSLLALTAVVVVTGVSTGGFGVLTLGGNQYGGKKYFFFLAAVAGYFALTSRRIPLGRAAVYVALFFLSALTYAVSEFAGLAGRQVDYLWLFLAPQTSLNSFAQEAPLSLSPTPVRFYGFFLAGGAVCSYLLARVGVRGLLDVSRPWRLLLFVVALGAGLSSGFRSFVVLAALTFTILFFLEGLHRTRYLPVLLGVVLMGGLLVLPQAQKLPLMAQRALSFLPGKFDYRAEESAATTVEWRLTMWKELLPEVPKRLFRGKGWGFDAREFYTAYDIGGGPEIHTGTILVGDYHNGPLSIAIPFGLYGVLAFAWFLIAALRVMYRNAKFGDPALRTVNRLLLAAFAAQVVFFIFFFGALHSDMAIFAGLLGLSVALNGAGAPAAQVEQSAAGMEFSTEYIKA